MAEITLNHVYKKYEGGVTAVQDFTLEIPDKEFVIFVGPSGCGKSTTLRMIAGLESISEGELLIDGERMNEVESCNRNIAMVFQSYALYPHMTVFENIAYSMKLKKVPKKEIKERVHEVAQILKIEEILDRKPGQLSGGQKQRVAMGRAIVRHPKVFLMDEPLSNLDAKLRTQMRIEIMRLYKELQTTFIYVTHDQTEAMTLGTRIVVMKDGIIQQVDTPQRLYDFPANRFVAGFMVTMPTDSGTGNWRILFFPHQAFSAELHRFVAGFIGSPQMNFISGICRVKKTGVFLETADCEVQITDGRKERLRNEGYDGKQVTMGVRPEHVKVWSPEESEVSDLVLQSQVSVYEMLGAEAYLYFTYEGQQVSARVKADTKIRKEDKVFFGFDTKDMILFDFETEEAIY